MSNVAWARKRRARAGHTCCECLVPIDVGEHYIETTGIWDGQPDRFRQCLFCGELFALASSHPDVFHEEDGPTFGGLFAWLCDFAEDPRDKQEAMAVFPRVMLLRAESEADWHARMAIRRRHMEHVLGLHVAWRIRAQREMFRWRRAVGAPMGAIT